MMSIEQRKALQESIRNRFAARRRLADRTFFFIVENQALDQYENDICEALDDCNLAYAALLVGNVTTAFQIFHPDTGHNMGTVLKAVSAALNHSHTVCVFDAAGKSESAFIPQHQQQEEGAL